MKGLPQNGGPMKIWSLNVRTSCIFLNGNQFIDVVKCQMIYKLLFLLLFYL